jgi:regulator of chromosome condensation (RCC1) repeat-containing protein
MSIRINNATVRLAVAALAFAAMGGAPSARAAVPVAGASITVKETARIRDADSTPRASSRVRVVASVGSGAKPQSLSVTLGGFTVDVALKNGRFRGRIFIGTGTVLADVQTRGHVLEATLRARVRDGGSVLGETVVRDAAAAEVETGVAYDLEEATLAIDGVSTQLALGLAARIDAATGADGVTRTRARVTGAAIAPASPPVVQVPGAHSDDPWTGRVAGHVLAAGSVPRAAAALSGALPFLVEPFDAAAFSYGSATVDSPGVRSLTIGSDTYYQVRFDMAVQSVPGPQTLVVGIPEGAGYAAKQTVEFTVPETAAPVALSAHDQVLEVRGDQTLWAWGDNQLGAVGDGSTKDPVSPVQLAQPASARAVAAGENVSLALDVGGGVWLWGEWNSTRVLAGGVTETRDVGSLVPEPVADLPSGVLAIAAGDDHALALDFEGEVWAFGQNYAGQLGDGTFDDHARHPQHVRQVPPVAAVAAGGTASLALDTSGVVWAWGVQNLAGIGDGTQPVAVTGLPTIVAVRAGGGHALALDIDGNVWAWGLNGDGQLGDGTQTDSDVPVQVSGLASVVMISAGASHSLAVLADGTVWAWGGNGAGQLGDGTSQSSSVPVRVRDLTGVTMVSAGASSSFAVDGTDALWVWGGYRFVRGPVGDGGVAPRLAARGFVEGHYPRAAEVVLPKTPR